MNGNDIQEILACLSMYIDLKDVYISCNDGWDWSIYFCDDLVFSFDRDNMSTEKILESLKAYMELHLRRLENNESRVQR